MHIFRSFVIVFSLLLIVSFQDFTGHKGIVEVKSDILIGNDFSIEIDSSLSKNYPCVDTLLREYVINDTQNMLGIFKLLRQNGKCKIVFKDSLFSDSLSAFTGWTYFKELSKVIVDTIFLNKLYLDSACREYLISAISHEGYHVYINWTMFSFKNSWNNVNLRYLKEHFRFHWKWLTKMNKKKNQYRQHALMTSNFITQMADDLYRFTNPAIPDSLRKKIALGLTYGGLDLAPEREHFDKVRSYDYTVIDGFAGKFKRKIPQDTVYFGEHFALKSTLTSFQFQPVCH